MRRAATEKKNANDNACRRIELRSSFLPPTNADVKLFGARFHALPLFLCFSPFTLGRHRDLISPSERRRGGIT